MNDPTSTPKVSFTNRTFQSFTSSFLAFLRATRPEVYTDFTQAQLGQVLIDMAAIVVDQCSYGQDVVASEIFLSTCQRYESALRFAKSVGYIPRLASAAVVSVRTQDSLPASLIANGGTIVAGSKIRGQNGLSYELIDDAVVAIGDTLIRLSLKEGESFEQTFGASASQNQVVRGSSGVVEEGSWDVFVGDPTNSANLWTQVDNVTFEASATKTYDTSFDDVGRLYVRFGDGSAGLIPAALITLRYRTTKGAAGNAPVSAIKGSMKVALASPGTGNVAVTLENRDDDAAVSGGTQLHEAESAGTTAASATQSGTVGSTPILNGSLVLTIVLPGGAGTIVLQDTNAGTFAVLSNTSARTLVSSAITYSTGAWSVQLDSAIASGGTMVTTYFAIVAESTSTAALVGAAVGGRDRESLTELKKNIPAYIRSQNKVLSEQDYVDALKQVPGIALSFVAPYISSYTANLVRVSVWGSELVGFQSESKTGLIGSPVDYTRYAQVGTDSVGAVQDYLRDRSVLTVSNVVLRPTMLWADVYLGDVTYDRRQDPAVLRAAIASAVVAVFEEGTGFDVRLSDVYDAVRSTTGVKFFTLQRVATGTQATSDEVQGATLTSPTTGGTLLVPVVTPRSVEITILQGSGTTIVLADNGSGVLTVKSGTATLLSGSVNYVTGVWTATFSANLIPNQPVVAAYANVTHDYRHDQIVTLDSVEDGDNWPPPAVAVSSPVTTPPYLDGKPVSAERLNVAQVAPYLPGDVLTYERLKDLTADATLTSRHYYNDEFLYNNEIFYDSVENTSLDVQAINLRRLIFDLVPA